MRWKKGAKIGTNVRPFAVDCAMGAPGERKKKEIGEQSHSPSIPIDFEVGARFSANGSEGGKKFSVLKGMQ